MAMNGIGNEACATSRDVHHASFDMALERLEESVSGLNDLLLRITQPPSPTGKAPTAPRCAPTLAEFLHSGSDRVTKIRQRVDELVSAISAELF